MQSPMTTMKPHSLINAYKKGANLFFQGEVPRRGTMVADGVVRAYTIDVSGEEKTISFFTQNDILPLSWLMGKTSTSLFYYEAVTDVRTLQFTKEDFETYILGEQQALLGMFETLSSDYTAAMLRINGLEQSRAEDKIAFTLYYLLYRYGIKTKKEDVYTINITLRHTTIASLVGLTRESTTKILGKLQKTGVIHYQKGTYSVDKQQLENHIGEDAFRDMLE